MASVPPPPPAPESPAEAEQAAQRAWGERLHRATDAHAQAAGAVQVARTQVANLTAAGDVVGGEVDPETGLPVPHEEVVVLPSSTQSIVHEGKTSEVQLDGSFDVPDDLAGFLLRGPDWRRGPAPFA